MAQAWVRRATANEARTELDAAQKGALCFHDCTCAPPLTQPCPDWALTALPDVEELLKLEPDHSWGRAAKERLAKAIEERNKQMTDEMLGTVESSTLPPSHRTQPPASPHVWASCGVVCIAGKLKDLGNSLLGKIGLSLDNFQMKKDPTSGSYSINFQQ